MNIGIVTTWFERGAAYVSRQYKELLSTAHNVYIYARAEKYAMGNPIWDSKEVAWGKKSSISMPTAIDFRDFKRWVVKNKLDTVFFNEQRWWWPVVWCNEMGVKTGSYIDYYTKETVPFFGAYDFLICNTKRHYSVFDWHPQSFYVPWGTGIKLFMPRSLKLIESNTVTFFHSAGMSPERKGCDLVLQAFDQIKGKAKLVIHCQQNLKARLPKLIDLINKLENSGRLILIEKTVPAPGLYHMGDVYVYPSRVEGVGLTIAEALASGLPVITSDEAPMNEFVDGTNGKTVRASKIYSKSVEYYWPSCLADLKSLQECMQYYIDNKNNLEKMKKQARLYAENNLDWSRNKGKILQIFGNVQSINDSSKKSCLEEIIRFENKRYIRPRLSIINSIFWLGRRFFL